MQKKRRIRGLQIYPPHL